MAAHSSYIYKVCIQHWYSNIILWLIGHRNTNGVRSPIFILISEEQWGVVLSRIKYASYHQVSCCINFPPGLIYTIYNRKHKWEVASAKSDVISYNPTEETKSLTLYSTLEDAGKKFTVYIVK